MSQFEEFENLTVESPFSIRDHLFCSKLIFFSTGDVVKCCERGYKYPFCAEKSTRNNSSRSLFAVQKTCILNFQKRITKMR